jgi:hypothetical protein
MTPQTESINFIRAIANEAAKQPNASDAAFSYMQSVARLNDIAHNQLLQCLPNGNTSKVMFLTVVLNLMLSCRITLDEEIVDELNREYAEVKNQLNGSVN